MIEICEHEWVAVDCERVPEEDFEMENDFEEDVYFIVEKTIYVCKHCGSKDEVYSSRPD